MNALVNYSDDSDSDTPVPTGLKAPVVEIAEPLKKKRVLVKVDLPPQDVTHDAKIGTRERKQASVKTGGIASFLPAPQHVTKAQVTSVNVRIEEEQKEQDEPHVDSSTTSSKETKTRKTLNLFALENDVTDNLEAEEAYAHYSQTLRHRAETELTTDESHLPDLTTDKQARIRLGLHRSHQMEDAQDVEHIQLKEQVYMDPHERANAKLPIGVNLSNATFKKRHNIRWLATQANQLEDFLTERHAEMKKRKREVGSKYGF